MKGKKILLIGPGTSILNSQGKIRKYQEAEKPLTVGINFIPDDLDIDFVFLSRPVRYDQALPKITGRNIRTIATTNITPVGKPFDYSVRYDALIENTEWDNALAIFLNLLEKIGIQNIALAGFDGFKKTVEENYVSNDFDLSKRYNYLAALNRCMTRKISKCRETMDILFLTESLYEGRQ